MKWERIAKRVRDHAHKLRQALASAVELRTSGKWGDSEVEAAGLRDYQRVFGHAISPRTFWRLFDRVIQLAGGSNDFNRLDLYLPNTVVAKKPTPAFAQAAADLPNLMEAVLGASDPSKPNLAELQLIWTAACEEWERLSTAGAPSTKATKIIVQALAASGLELARTPRGLRVTFRRKLERWIEGGYSSDAIRDKRSECSGNRRPLPLSDDDRKLLIARSLQGSVTKAWREMLRQGNLSPETTQTYITTPASKSYVPRRVRNLIGPDVAMLDDIHHGPRQAALKGAYITRDWSDVLPGDWYSADDTTLVIYYWEKDRQGVVRVKRGQTLVMIDCRSGRILAYALHSERNYTAKVIRGLILRTHDTYGLPRYGFYFENGLWRKAKLIKGTGDEVPGVETELGLREFCKFRHAKPGNPRAKTVERIIGIMQDNMEDQPGYCGRNEQVEKFERLNKNLLGIEAGRIDPCKVLLHRDEWVERLHNIADAYNNEIQEGQMITGLSPRQAWETLFDLNNPLVRLSSETRYLLANHRRPEKVTRNGIRIQFSKEPHWFRNEVTGRLIGQTVQVYFNPEDMSSIFIKLSTDDKVAHVIPAVQAIPAMSATPEQLAAAYASVASQNSGTITLYQEIKSYFPDNGPSPFRRVVADADTVELSQEIAADQQAIKEQQNKQATVRRQVARYERTHGPTPDRDAISDERKLTGYKLLEEANLDANT